MSSLVRKKITLTGATYGARYHGFEPGVTPTERVQAEMAGELDSHAVSVMVLTEGFWEEPNESSRDQGIDLLDRDISENFQIVARFGEYRILERRPRLSGPPAGNRLRDSILRCPI